MLRSKRGADQSIATAVSWKAAMAKTRAAQVARAGGTLELVEREVPEPRRGEVRVRVEACGICHSDSFTVEGQVPGISFPRIPGHEIASLRWGHELQCAFAAVERCRATWSRSSASAAKLGFRSVAR